MKLGGNLLVFLCNFFAECGTIKVNQYEAK